MKSEREQAPGISFISAQSAMFFDLPPSRFRLPSSIFRFLPLCVLCAPACDSLLSSSAGAGEKVVMEVRETAGIRRFGYPVAAELKFDRPVPADAKFRLLENGKPIVAQFRPVRSEGDRIAAVALDFDGGFMPYESHEYVVEYGPDVSAGPEPDRGLKIEETDESFLISNGPNLSWTIPKNLLGLIRSVSTPKTDYLRPDSAGLVIRHKDDIHHRVGSFRPDGAPTRARVVKQGPIDCTLRFETTEALRGNCDVSSTVEMNFPRSKSWIQVTWSVEDPKGFIAGLGMDLNLNVVGEPTLVDFGAGSLVYATLARGQTTVLRSGVPPTQKAGEPGGPLWETLRGTRSKLEPYVLGPRTAVGQASAAEGWAHLMDRERCTAVAIADFARSALDRIEVDSDGRLQVWRDFAVTGSAPLAGQKSLTFWLHFVPMPPHVGAVTSPQSMQLPLEVVWKVEGEERPAESIGRGAIGQSPKTDEAATKGQAVEHEIESLKARAKAALAKTSGELRLTGLKDKVEVLRDKWGVPHIYAQNQDDLFFTQGFVQAQDRLWQMEIWRRTTEGRLAEIVGPAAVERDRVARLVRYRGDLDAEWTSYSRDAKQIIEAFVRGVNAFIDLCRDNPPIEFQLTGIKPEPWTPDVCLGRMAGFIMCRNASAEVLRAELVRELGPEEAAKLLPTDPPQQIRLPAGLDLDGIDQRIVTGINAANATVKVPLAAISHSPLDCLDSVGSDDADKVGSNNWTVSGQLTTTGKPILASDPHRPITLPSLRYLVHLNCPSHGADRGWNVIGGTEPALPGIALGHNDRVAWGMTIVGTDQMDLYVEETQPDDATRYRVGDEWQSMRIERDPIRVRGEPDPRTIELKFTRHGPVFFEDTERHRAYALRWTGSEPGSAGYLAALSLDRVGSWPEFLEAASRWKIPSLNLVYADLDGHIGWIAAALTPVRRNWDGLLPVPGALGRYEWDGFLPTTELPQRLDPPVGYIATANHNILPPGFRHQISYEWAAPFRFQRIDEVLRSRVRANGKFTIEDFEKLQHDATSIPARRLLAVLRESKLDDPSLRPTADLLLRWNGVLSKDSTAAAIYEMWQTKLSERVLKSRVPEKLWERYSNRLPLQAMLDLIERPDSAFGGDPRSGRDALLIDALRDAVADLQIRLGPDQTAWQWGKLHQAKLQHMLALGSNAVISERAAEGQSGKVVGRELGGEGRKNTAPSNSAITDVFGLPHVPRDGDGNTPLAAGGPRPGNFDQTTGASYRHILNLADWDRSVFTSVPGQSGQPGSPHYGDLLSSWAEGKYLPLNFSRAAVEAASTENLLLLPDGNTKRQ